MMKKKWIYIAAIPILGFFLNLYSADAKDTTVSSRLAAYEGKVFAGVQDPEYLSYDQALRNYVAKRIDQQFGITLDPKTYSGFDLLEIEALFKCKKSNEPFDLFLRMFPKGP